MDETERRQSWHRGEAAASLFAATGKQRPPMVACPRFPQTRGETPRPPRPNKPTFEKPPVSTGTQRMWAASPSSAEEDSQEAELHPGEGARSLAHSIAEDPETPGLAPDLGQKRPTTARAPSGRGHGRAPASLISRTGSRPGAQATRGPEDRMAGSSGPRGRPHWGGRNSLRPAALGWDAPAAGSERCCLPEAGPLHTGEGTS